MRKGTALGERDTVPFFNLLIRFLEHLIQEVGGLEIRDLEWQQDV